MVDRLRCPTGGLPSRYQAASLICRMRLRESTTTTPERSLCRISSLIWPRLARSTPRRSASRWYSRPPRPSRSVTVAVAEAAIPYSEVRSSGPVTAALRQPLVVASPSDQQKGARGGGESGDSIQRGLQQRPCDRSAAEADQIIGNQADCHNGGKQVGGSPVKNQAGDAHREKQQDGQRGFKSAKAMQNEADQNQIADQRK